jgi:hypothetical protein
MQADFCCLCEQKQDWNYAKKNESAGCKISENKASHRAFILGDDLQHFDAATDYCGGFPPAQPGS